MRPQEFIHWLEQGSGARWLRRAALLLGLLALSATVSFKQFHGPRTEETLRQANLGRALAAGEGFASRVHYPQVRAFEEQRGRAYDPAQPGPELYQPPGYSLAVAGALAVLPDGLRARLFERVPAAPDGFGGDYVLLVLNVVLLWLAAVQTWRLGRALFDPTSGAVAALALLLSVPVWQHAVAVDGTPLAMVGLLAVFQVVLAALRLSDRPGRAAVAWLAAGVVAGALFLIDYPLGLLVPVVAGFAAWRGRPPAAAWVVAGALLVGLPWLLRNVAVSGRPLGLAGQDVALRAGDPTAEPAEVRTSLRADAPPISLNKVGNKTLTGLQVALQERLWSDGGLFLAAFFVAGWLYRFRREEANRLRALFGVALLVLIVGRAALNSGEGERHITAVAAPLILVFGAGFFGVLVASSNRLSDRPRLAAAGLLVLQGLPLAHDLLEPRQIHFSYPPYYPAFFQGMATEMARRGGEHPSWMADVPAGAAWYSGQRVWAQPRSLRDFYAVHAEQPLLALVLTPHTLDRPFFSELAAAGPAGASRFGDWGDVYRALIREQVPAGFPLARPQKLADNFYVLLDPRRVPWRGK